MRAITQDEMKYAELVYEMELEACQPCPYFRSRHVDTHKPCPVCGRPFETSTIRSPGCNPLEHHIREAQDEAHKKYREQKDASGR